MKYQPIDTAPKDGTEVLLWEKYGYVPVVALYSVQAGKWRASREHYDVDGDAYLVDTLCQEIITHWAPLPTPPESEA